MCGITGFFGQNASGDVGRSLDAMASRGHDARKIQMISSGALGHVLHSLVGYVEQPLVGKGVFVTNCEIYNWQDLCLKYQISARNDAELLFFLLEQRPLDDIPALVEELDGVFAFAYVRDQTLVLARDLLGVKPLWYCTVSGFSFASEKKALLSCGKYDVSELTPRRILFYALATSSLSFVERPFFSLSTAPLLLPDARQLVRENLFTAVKKHIPY